MSDHAIGCVSEMLVVSHEKTAIANEEAHQASVATGRAAHEESAAAGATTATAHDRLSAKTAVRGKVHVTTEDEAARTVTASLTETAETHHEVPAVAHLHPPALADPTLLLVVAR